MPLPRPASASAECKSCRRVSLRMATWCTFPSGCFTETITMPFSKRCGTPGGGKSVGDAWYFDVKSPVFMRLFCGPGRGGRTHTTLRSPDFESGASASSAIPGIKNNITHGTISPHQEQDYLSSAAVKSLQRRERHRGGCALPQGKMKSECIEQLQKEIAEEFAAGARADEVRKASRRSTHGRAKTLYDIGLRKHRGAVVTASFSRERDVVTNKGQIIQAVLIACT
jgi:hypothetical protein